MKRILILVLGLALIMTASVAAQDVKGKMYVGGYGSYALGFGEWFDTFDFGTYEIETKAGIGFGGTFHYGVTEKIMVGGELSWQQYKVETSGTIGGFSAAGDASSTEMNILFNGLYVLQDDDEKAFFLTAGAGLYGGEDSNVGINGGIVYRMMVSETVGIYGMPRFHFIFSDPSAYLLQLAVGVHIPIGSN